MRNVGWRGLVLSVPVLLAGLAHGSAQVTPTPPAPAVPPITDIENNAVKPEEHRPPSSDQSTRDETVGYGGSVERAPRDETVGHGGSVDRAPRDVREPFDE